MKVYWHRKHVLVYHNSRYWDLHTEKYINPCNLILDLYIPRRREIHTKNVAVSIKWILCNLETIVIYRTETRIKFFVPELYITIDSENNKTYVSGFYSKQNLYALVNFINKISQ